MIVSNLIEFFGRFHPILVHLPIGILFIGLLLQWLSNKYEGLKYSISVIFLVGALCAVASCISGYLLSLGDDYEKSTINLHMWSGIGVAFLSLLIYAREKYSLLAFCSKRILSIGLFILIILAGHLGGSLTHGADYLTSPLKKIFAKDSIDIKMVKPIEDVQNAIVYTDVVEPIFASKCYSCHSSEKQKGGLRMDMIALLMKGGKNGKIIVPGNADGSEVIKRLLLPVDNEHHMPPKEKPQLTESQVDLIHWWITNHADTQKKVYDLVQSAKMRKILIALQISSITKTPIQALPNKPVKEADNKILNQLKSKDIIILPIAQNTNYLTVNFVTDSLINEERIQLLLKLKPQLVSLKLANTNINDEALGKIGKLTNLIKLDLSNTTITDKGLLQLSNLVNLQYLNLRGTKISINGILQLKKLKNLLSLYLYNSGFQSKNLLDLKAVFPNTTIDTGRYRLIKLVSDTILVK